MENFSVKSQPQEIQYYIYLIYLKKLKNLSFDFILRWHC